MATTVALTGPYLEVTNDDHERMYLGKARDHDGYAIIVGTSVFPMTRDEWKTLIGSMDAVV